jgi:hypothetical protein
MGMIAGGLLLACLRDSGAQAGVADNLTTPLVTAEQAIADWPSDARLAAKIMIEEYGQPNEINEQHSLVWHNNGPWKRTVVSREPLTALNSGDFLQQVVSYRVPVGKPLELESFSRHIGVNKAENELFSCSNSEKMNFLALNLAYDIIQEKKSAEQARRFYGEVETLMQAGKTSSYTEGLIFPVTNEIDDQQPFYQAL